MRKDRPCILKTEDITMQFGGVVAVNNFSMEEYEGEIVAIIGPNGAGKTTAFNVITGVYAPTNGRVTFDGKTVIENCPRGKMKKSYLGENVGKYTRVIEPTPDRLTALGMARTFQNIRLWKSMTVFDNVLIAKHMKRSSNLFSATFGFNRAEDRQQREEADALIETVGLADVRDELSTSLPYGPRHRAEAPPPGRAGRRHEPAGDGGADKIHRRDPRSVPCQHFAHRAPHGPRHGHLGKDLCPGLRQHDCLRHTGRDPGQRKGHRCLSGGDGRCLK